MSRGPEDTPTDIADDLLMDGLLRSRHLDVQIDRERRLRTLMDSIEGMSTEREPGPTSWRPWRLASAAVIGLAVLIGMLVLDRQTSSAHAELWRSLEQMETRADLSFELEILESTPRGEQDPRGPGNRWRATDGMLHIRGPKYVITRTLPDGVVLAGGFDGEAHWSNMQHSDGTSARMVRGPVRRLEELLARLSLNLGKELRRLRRGYDIGPPEVERDADGRRLLHFVGTRRPPKGGSDGDGDRRTGPRTAARIDIWFDPDDRRIVELRLDGLTARPDGPSMDLRLRAIEPPSLPNDFFDASGHPIVERPAAGPGRGNAAKSPDPDRRRRRPEAADRGSGALR